MQKNLHNYYWTGKKDYQPGISSGLSLQSDGNLGFYLGGSLLFQESNRLIFSTGISFTKVNKLNTANLGPVENGIRDFITPTDTEIRYDRVYRPSLFVGITYNLSSNKSKESIEKEANK